jgi:transcriptional regulator of acetoin/glycerol metabolism
MPGDLFPEQGERSVAERTAIAPLGAARKDAERRHIQRALAITGGAILPAARALGISRTTLWEKTKRYGLLGSETCLAGTARGWPRSVISVISTLKACC